MSTRDINDVIKQIYGKDLSLQAVTEITKELELDLPILAGNLQPSFNVWSYI